MNISPVTRKRIETVAFNRAADHAKDYAEHWEREARADRSDPESTRLAKLKAGHWRIIEKEIRSLGYPMSERR